jgi:ABC-2 type transport system ATP-binding protein
MSFAGPALVCDALTRTFGDSKRGVFDVTLSIPSATVYGLMGGNGAGKTTLINLCLGLLKPDGGRVSIGGVDMSERGTSARRRVAYVPEVARLYGQLNALENIRFFEQLNGRHADDAEIEAALAGLSFPSVAVRRPARTYSKGMRQKVVIAMGLIKSADLFLLDEPTSGLDPASTRQLITIVRGLRSDGRAVLISTHDSYNICDYADRVGIMREGRLVHDGPAAKLDARAIDELVENA